MTSSKKDLQQFQTEICQGIKILKDKKKKKKKKTSSVFGSYGELFLKQGRPYFYLRGCAILCITTYKVIGTGEELRITTVKKSSPHQFGLGHAEILVFNEINLTEKKNNCKAVRVELFSSYSPCIKCCHLIQQFLYLRPQCEMSIAFTCVYRDNDQQHRYALRWLYKNTSVIGLDVFREEKWEVLQDMALVDLTPEQYTLMRLWDEYWRNILTDIMGWNIMVEELWLAQVSCESQWADFQPQWEVFQWGCEAFQWDGAELKIDGLQALQKHISVYKKAKLEEMDKKVREAIRRRNREDLLLFLAMVCVGSFALRFLIREFIL